MSGRAVVHGQVQHRAAQPDDQLEPRAGVVQHVRDEIADTGNVTGEPVFTRVVRLNAASPQYTVGHLDRVSRIERSTVDIPGLAIAGNMLRGVGIPDAIAAGEAASDKILA